MYTCFNYIPILNLNTCHNFTFANHKKNNNDS